MKFFQIVNKLPRNVIYFFLSLHLSVYFPCKGLDLTNKYHFSIALGPAYRRILAHILSSVFISFIINVYFVSFGANKNETSSSEHTVRFSTKQSGEWLQTPGCRFFKLTVCSEEVKDSLSKNNNNKKPPPSYGWCGGMVLDEMRLEKFFSKTSQRRFCWQGKGIQKLLFRKCEIGHQFCTFST